MYTILLRASLAGILAASALHPQTASSNPAPQPAARYTVKDLGTFGGTYSIAFGINNEGRIGGSGSLPNEDTPAFLTGIGNTKYAIRGLGGANTQAGAPNGLDNLSLIAETTKADPLNEDFCGFGDHMICLGGLWNGATTALPTLGGNNAMSAALNDRGQIAGVAENAVHDPACPAPQLLDFEAALWDPSGAIQLLPPLAGDTVGFALAINSSGQVVGSSGNCANTAVTATGLFYGPHPVLWQNGTPLYLGSLGGVMMGKAGAINNRGEVSGFSGLPGDAMVHAFLWTQASGMKDLGGLGSDVLADPAGINNNTQIVGGSCDAAGNCRAFLWDNNVLSDLNDLIPSNSPLYLLYGLGINDAGEIVGFALENNTGNVHAYLATPIPVKPSGPGAVQAAPAAATTNQQALPENIRMLLRQRAPLGRLGIRGIPR